MSLGPWELLGSGAVGRAVAGMCVSPVARSVPAGTPPELVRRLRRPDHAAAPAEHANQRMSGGASGMLVAPGGLVDVMLSVEPMFQLVAQMMGGPACGIASLSRAARAHVESDSVRALLTRLFLEPGRRRYDERQDRLRAVFPDLLSPSRMLALHAGCGELNVTAELAERRRREQVAYDRIRARASGRNMARR